eukprot:gnl/TRDRNA2_/TRDRNA2_169287_c1_seq1.p1 gnl/TRDRNA2_/TRDRNA2_169287_c1~~gnl/TRDRNA2_/TRDRNA2_169287_c1_seq1.p1  ORF type:complete len:165 (-),score=42.16 gnl/TRDRNA2_/TRDRNA2_169287_c1_seq1:92-544(-)
MGVQPVSPQRSLPGSPGDGGGLPGDFQGVDMPDMQEDPEVAPMDVKEPDLPEPDLPELPPVRQKLQAIQDAGEDAAGVKQLQERQLRQAFERHEAEVSFNELCDGPPGGAEAAALRFISLLAMHTEGLIAVSQAEPFADILIGPGPIWPS